MVTDGTVGWRRRKFHFHVVIRICVVEILLNLVYLVKHVGSCLGSVFSNCNFSTIMRFLLTV